MSTELINFQHLNNSTYVNMQLEIPDSCPYCFKSISARVMSKTKYDSQQKLNVSVLFQCPSCRKFFAKEYKVGSEFNRDINGYRTNLIPYKMVKNITYDLPEEVESVSKSFKEIYYQALVAESENLEQICGIGYRKSIEFLIKDFLINFMNQDKEKISKLPLGQAIKKVENDRIQSLATASTWLGNDETHYQRKYEDRDLTDMKRFIKALTFYISSEVVASEAEEFISK